MAARSRLTGIELDPLTASIARHLYPDAEVLAQGFETARLVEGSFDLAISNVPFGDYKVIDSRFDERNFLVHDYFFAKGLQQVRPGGLLVFITSKGTLDKVNSGLRDYLSDKADFVAAIRLPNNAFRQNANTEVTTDIIFLRKLEEGERPANVAWLKVAEHKNAEGAVFRINEYFAANPRMMLGTMAMAGSMYRTNDPALVPDGRDLGDALREAVSRLPQGIYRAAETANSQSVNGAEVILSPEHVKENAFTLHDGTLAVRTGNALTPLVNLPDETARRIKGLIKVRDVVREVLRTQLQGASDEEIARARRELNLRYDSFSARFGPVNDTANRRAFRGDPDYPLLCSLEDYNDETKRAEKTAIFRERTIQKAQSRMYTTSRFLLPLVFCALLGGCAGISPTRIIGDTVGAAGGALIGSTLSKGNPLIAAAGAGGGLLVSEALQAGSSSANQKSYASGYEKGRSDATKQQFQALINQQRTAPGINDAANVRLLDVPLPERQVNGVTLAPTTATLRIQE